MSESSYEREIELRGDIENEFFTLRALSTALKDTNERSDNAITLRKIQDSVTLIERLYAEIDTL